MARFLSLDDYEDQIKQEIRKLLDGSTPTNINPYKLIKAEDKAISQIRNFLANRFDCDTIFAPPVPPADNRDMYMVMVTIDVALYHLYSQSPNKDIPEHRQQRYQDALDWLKLAGTGKVPTNLPSILSEERPGDVRIWSKPPQNNEW